jgi:hypothetical protein
MEISAPELRASIKPCNDTLRDARRRQLHKCYLRPGLGNGTEIIDHVGLGHANPTIADAEKLIFFVRDYANEKLLLRLENRWIGKGGIANFVESI